jgi:hypothetical protein
VVDGTDLIVSVDKVPGKKYPDVTFRLLRKNSPLSEDSTKISTWIKDQPSVEDAFDQMDHDMLKKLLKNKINELTGEGEEEGDSDETETTVDGTLSANGKTTERFKLEDTSSGEKPDILKKFDQLLEEE